VPPCREISGDEVDHFREQVGQTSLLALIDASCDINGCRPGGDHLRSDFLHHLRIEPDDRRHSGCGIFPAKANQLVEMLAILSHQRFVHAAPADDLMKQGGKKIDVRAGLDA